MIPKVIHYCWFGSAPLDDMALRCIESWKRFFPDYEIIQWDENNFDISSCDFIKKAYADKKWAFVSDVARLMVVYEHGGIYFDTDVEVVAAYDDVLDKAEDGFLGLESTMHVNTGLGFGAAKHSWLLKELLSVYESLSYESYRDSLSQVACPVLTTDYLIRKGLIRENVYQRLCGFDIYPTAYFSPLDFHTGKLSIHPQTHSIHWYNASWLSQKERLHLKRTHKLSAIVGKRSADFILGMLSCILKEGLVLYIWNRMRKYIRKIIETN